MEWWKLTTEKMTNNAGIGCKHHFDAGKVRLNDLVITYTLTLGLDMIGPSNMVQ